ncbi:MAG: heparinase II/III family protein [Gemmatimonadaceae bacterium]
MVRGPCVQTSGFATVSAIVTAKDLEERKPVATGPLSALRASLRRDLDPLLARDFHLPADKALLSRDGGRCPVHGTLLDFDPYSPHEHRCAACNATYHGRRHDLWWIMSYQLWLAERSVHAAVLYSLSGEAALAALAAGILHAYADGYLRYPNRDNVLGPSRPFFSTYLESIWLLQICIAAELLETARAPGFRAAAIRESVVEPSAALISSYDEGISNRQVWNNAALMISGMLLGLREQVTSAVTGRSGLITHLADCLLHDGTWYEGENYHFFAHRGLWYCMRLAQQAGFDIPHALATRFREGFAAPLATVLPDFTFPARRDSQYAVSLRQWRFAESFELGLALGDDDRVAGALWQLYETPAVAGDTGRWRSTGDAERNEPASALSRADLGWRSLLFARPVLRELKPWQPRSKLLEGQGIAVFRRNSGRVYAALDYGHSGGGHGHPDRLNLLLVNGEERWLDDMGTGSYVDPSLHWYRSTLSHNAPMVNGHSQYRVDGILRAHDERGGAGWALAEIPAGGAAPGVTISRSIVLMPDYLLDAVNWKSERDITFDLPVHVSGQPVGDRDWTALPLTGGSDIQDGFGFVRETAFIDVSANEYVELRLHGSLPGRAWVGAGNHLEFWRAIAPGPQGLGDRQFFLLRANSADGRITSVWSWQSSVQSVEIRQGVVVVTLADGTRHEHIRSEAGWHIDLFAAGARSSIDLGGQRPAAPVMEYRVAPLRKIPEEVRRIVVGESPPLRFHMGRFAYRRSEDSWEEAGRPEARVTIAAEVDELTVEVAVQKSPLLFRVQDAEDPALDNEHPDIHSDGVQFYLQASQWTEPAGWLAIPVAGSEIVRVRRIAGRQGDFELDASWMATPTGYSMRFRIPLSLLANDAARDIPFAFDVLVNDMGPGRLRRRGQLVLSGGEGEYVYLLGDRQPPSRFLHTVLSRG